MNQTKQYCITRSKLTKSNKPLKKSNNKSTNKIIKQKKKHNTHNSKQKSQKTKKPNVIKPKPRKHTNK